MTQPQTPIRATPLATVHESLGATFTDFAGWRMPVRYTSDLAEHQAVRTSAGVFDLSHMGEIQVAGPQAGEMLDHALAGLLSTMPLGRAKYSLLLNESGGVTDDLIVYRLADERFLVVANAANADLAAAELTDRAAGFDVTVTDQSADWALVAVQGPDSPAIVTEVLQRADSQISAEDLAALGYYRVLQGTFAGQELLVARTGYTGEDGFELFVATPLAAQMWELVAEVAGDRAVPCGLACRDTLRLEAGMPLHGHELGPDLFPAQSGLGRVVALSSKGDFVGRTAIEQADLSGAPVLVGLEAEGRRAARAESIVRDLAGQQIGVVSSGVLSPTLGHPIALAFLDPAHTDVDTEVVIDVRGKDLPARVVALPFYSRH